MNHLVTSRELEDEYGVSAARLRKWVQRNQVAPAVRGLRPHLYRIEDIMQCLKDRRSPKRTAVIQRASEIWLSEHGQD